MYKVFLFGDDETAAGGFFFLGGGDAYLSKIARLLASYFDDYSYIINTVGHSAQMIFFV